MECLTAGAGHARADDPVHDEAAGDIFQLFGYILAQLLEPAAARRAGLARREHRLKALQVIRQRPPLWPAFFTWQMFYWCQFIALEFFFRGFMVHGLRHRFGIYSVFVMTVPYCMIHFGKPMPETFAAIVAGIVLGFMSLKTRSIWLGAALHIGVAATMDGLALWRLGPLG